MKLHTRQDYQCPKTTIFSLQLGSIVTTSFKLKEGDGFNVGDPGDEGTDMQLTRQQGSSFDSGDYWNEGY